MKTPLVAIITRTKDRPALLPRACESVFKQSFKDFIWVVVNDGGDFAPVTQLVRSAAAQGIRTLQINNKTSKGMEAASNLGCLKSNSKYIVIHDDDDTWEPDFLQETVAFLEAHPHYAGVVTRVTEVSEKVEGNVCTEMSRKPYSNNNWLRAIYFVDMLQRNMFPPIAFLFRRSIYTAVKGFDESLPVLGDWDFALKILQRKDIGFIAKQLANYHLRHATVQAKDAYANTVTHYTDIHAEYDMHIRNKWLRKDLKAGTFGLGTLLSFGRQHNAMWECLYAYRTAILDKKKKNP